MLAIQFAGWFQCRMATDPDPKDEPRGLSGTAFALVDEPDFDRVIRFQRPVAPRSPGPTVGVHVTDVRRGARAEPGHPLVGARVSLSGSPEFVEQNGVVAAPGKAFIDPFHLCIEADGVSVARSALWDPARPGLGYYDADADALRPRQVRQLEVDVADVKAATGIDDPAAFVRERREALAEALAHTEDPARRAGLQQRLDALDRTDWQRSRLLLLLSACVHYTFDLNGPAAIEGGAALPETFHTGEPWRVRFWMGGWDNDTLCGYVQGTLFVPASPLPAPKPGPHA